MRLALGLVALVLVLPADAAALELPASREVRLPNGALVILAEKHDVPMIAVRGFLRGGSVADPPGKEGVANLTASLLRKGAGKRTAEEIAALVEGLGASLDTGGGLEASYAVGEFMARDQNTMLDVIADLLRRPTFPEKEFEKLRDQSIDAITSAKDDPQEVIGGYAAAFFFGPHPYARPSDGDERTLKGLTREDVVAYYRANYGGDRLILTLVGDFDLPAMEAKVKTRFGHWAKAGAPLAAIPAVSRPRGHRVLLVDKPDATQTYFWIGSLGVTRRDPERVPLDIANTAFGGHYTSILNTALRIQGGLTYGARWQAPRYTQAGTVAIYSYTKTETTGKAVDLALETLAKARRAGLDSAAVASARSYITGQFPTRFETESQVASALVDLAYYGFDREELTGYAGRIAAARPDAIAQVVQRVYPPPEDLTFVFVGNASKIRSVVKRYGRVTEVKISEPLLSALGREVR